MSGPLSQAGWYALARLALGVGVGVLAGWLLGNVFAGIALVLAVGLCWQLVNLFWLDHWLQDRNGRDPPDARGLWGDVVSRVVRLHRRKRFHKERLLQVFRELRKSTAAMPDGVIILNPQDEISWFNRTAARLLGLRGKGDRGLRVTNLIREPAFHDYLVRGEFADPLTVTRGSENELSLSFQVIPYSADQRLVLVRNVSRQVALENMRKDFVANASHELRSPLTVMTGYLETLLSDPAMDEEMRSPLLEMQRQTQRMNGIVNDLLDLSRLDAQVAEAAGGPIDVDALCSMLRKDVLARVHHPQVSVVVESRARLLGEEPEIHSAFTNLVDNAVKFTPETGSITLRWRIAPTGEGEFSVADTGAGIAAEHLPRLTERFYRADAGRSRAAGGTGLGLAIVKHALMHHGATLHIESRPGEGSCFTCRFPARRVLAGPIGANIEPVSRLA